MCLYQTDLPLKTNKQIASGVGKTDGSEGVSKVCIRDQLVGGVPHLHVTVTAAGGKQIQGRAAGEGGDGAGVAVLSLVAQHWHAAEEAAVA